VMLLNAHTEDDSLPAGLGPHALRFGALLSALLAVEVVWGLSRVGVTGFNSDPGAASAISSVAAIGQTLFTQYSFAFEVTSILILVSMVGAVIIAGSRTRGGR
jgi:NADH-quinone oxidoreductase subunit J